MKTKEIILEVEEYIVIPEEELFTARDLFEFFISIGAVGAFVISLGWILFCLR